MLGSPFFGPALVALLAEGVDKNWKLYVDITDDQESPSSRRAWIEIPLSCSSTRPRPVALLAEGVDRNTYGYSM